MRKIVTNTILIGLLLVLSNSGLQASRKPAKRVTQREIAAKWALHDILQCSSKKQLMKTIKIRFKETSLKRDKVLQKSFFGKIIPKITPNSYNINTAPASSGFYTFPSLLDTIMKHMEKQRYQVGNAKTKTLAEGYPHLYEYVKELHDKGLQEPTEDDELEEEEFHPPAKKTVEKEETKKETDERVMLHIHKLLSSNMNQEVLDGKAKLDSRHFYRHKINVTEKRHLVNFSFWNRFFNKLVKYIEYEYNEYKINLKVKKRILDYAYSTMRILSKLHEHLNELRSEDETHMKHINLVSNFIHELHKKAHAKYKTGKYKTMGAPKK